MFVSCRYSRLVDRCWRILYQFCDFEPIANEELGKYGYVQGSGLRREIIKRIPVSTSACDKCSAEKHPYMYDQSFVANSSFPRPKHIRKITESGSCGISILLKILFLPVECAGSPILCVLLCQMSENLDTLQHRLVHCRQLRGNCRRCNACFGSSLRHFSFAGTKKKN